MKRSGVVSVFKAAAAKLRTNSGAAWGWAGVVFVLFAFLLITLPRVPVSSDVMELIPEPAAGQVSRAEIRSLASKMGRQVIFAVSGPEAAAEDFSNRLSKLPGFSSFSGRLDPVRTRDSARFLFEHRAAFLSQQTRSRLEEGGGAQAAWVLSQLYAPLAGVSSSELTRDPLLLMRTSNLIDRGEGGLRNSGGWLTGNDSEGRSWRILHAEVNPAFTGASELSSLVGSIREAERQTRALFPGVRFAASGAVFYSDYAGSSARHDVSKLGLISLALLLVLLIAAFRSVLPLALCLASIAVGAAAGAAATILVFGKIHLLTLVMSLSLIGISADYTTHYFTARMKAGAGVSTYETARGLRPLLLQALATTCAAYAAFLFAPFPGLRQLGIFSVAGLCASFVTVMVWYPGLTRRFRSRSLPFTGALQRYIGLWRGGRLFPWAVLALLALFSVSGIILAGTDDDIGALQSSPPGLRAQEQVIASITGRDTSQRWFIVQGSTPDEALDRKDLLQAGLVRLRAEGLIEGATVVPLHSLRAQREDAALIERAMPEVKRRLAQAGISVRTGERLHPLELRTWLRDYLSRSWSGLIEGGVGRTVILVPVQAGRSAKADEALAALAGSVPGCAWVDRRSDFSQLFGEVRKSVTVTLAAAGAAIILAYGFACGPLRALGLLIPCALSIASGIAALGWAGMPVNIFSLFALILILGIGIDYSLFFGSRQRDSEATLFAVVTAMLTTVASLGILVFSRTAAVANFGLALTTGVFAAFLASPVTLALEAALQRRRRLGRRP